MSNVVIRNICKPSIILRNARAMSKDSKSGSAGAIRDAGGKFAERENATENVYFKQEQAKQLKDLKKHLTDEISHHEEEIKRHQEAIARHQKKSEDLEKK